MSDIKLPEHISIYTDGGSRGNPGLAACAFVVTSINPQVILHQQGKALGVATNNQAEYSGVISALEWLTLQTENRSLPLQVNFYCDSQLIVRQINREYRVKDPAIYSLYSQAFRLIEKITKSAYIKITFTHIPREENSDSDRLVNQTLDNL